MGGPATVRAVGAGSRLVIVRAVWVQGHGAGVCHGVRGSRSKAVGQEVHSLLQLLEGHGPVCVYVCVCMSVCMSVCLYVCM